MTKQGWHLAGPVGAAIVASTVALQAVSIAADAANGKEVYAARCTKCHGPDGKGSPQVAQILQAEIPDLTAKAVQAKKDQDLLRIITKGSGKMPAFEWSSEAKEREDVVAYLRTLGKR
jgi:cytochrome c6